MTHKQVIEAYRALERLSMQPVPIKTAYQLHKLRRTLKTEWDFQTERERALLDELKPTAINRDKVTFRTAQDAEKWKHEMAELDAVESEAEYDPVTVYMTEDMRIAPRDIDMLDGFVIFEEG